VNFLPDENRAQGWAGLKTEHFLKVVSGAIRRQKELGGTSKEGNHKADWRAGVFAERGSNRGKAHMKVSLFPGPRQYPRRQRAGRQERPVVHIPRGFVFSGGDETNEERRKGNSNPAGKGRPFVKPHQIK